MITLPYRCQPHAWVGFSLVELMITVAIAAVLLAAAVPSFVDFIRGKG